MTLEFSARLAERELDVAFTIGPGETIALMGPNGAGKSSLVAILSGLLRPDDGFATLAGRPLFRTEAPQLWVPPHERGIGVLAQEPLLFPHLSVLDNVAFGPRSQGAGKAAAQTTAHHWLAEVEATELAGRKPGELSGGQAQRVALARALATNPELFLLDEPMAALDINSAPLLRRLLKRVLADRRAVIITHDPLDALMLADRVVIMEHGRIVQDGPTASVLSHPRSVFAASLGGLNVLFGSLGGTTLVMDDGGTISGRPVGNVGGGADVAGALSPQPATAAGGQAGLAAFPPSAVSVFLARPQGSPRNCFPVTVTELEPHGDQIRVRAGVLAADISPAATAELELAPGAQVFFVIKAAEVALYPA